jgi:exopolyphosphatase / guanosine-5'-triphosphate,3'-diphosphate pyrophosphatase
LRLAAIDIGSNAARLLISDVISGPLAKPEFLKIALVRVPLRLGFDVFERGEISPQKADNVIKTIQSYKLLLDVYGVKHLKACATSAMRDASNGKEIIQKVKAETGIDINIISGQEEASFIYENHFAEG